MKTAALLLVFVAGLAAACGTTLRTATVHDTSTVSGPDDQALAYLVDSFRGLQASQLYKTWAKANPGEVARFKAYLNDDPPAVWDGSFPLNAKMLTPFGAMLRDIVSVCKVLACPAQTLPNIPPPSAFPDTAGPTRPQTVVAQPAPITYPPGTYSDATTTWLLTTTDVETSPATTAVFPP